MTATLQPESGEDVKLGYRSLFSVQREDEPHAVEAGLAQLNSWLRGKRYDVDAMREDERVEIAEGVTATLVRLEERDGSTTVQANVLEERDPATRWESELTIHAPGRDHEPVSVLLDISGPIQPRTPRLARMLTLALPARDSSAVLSDHPIRVGLDDLEDVAEAACDPDRRGLLFIAGMDESLPYERWFEYVSQLLKETTGLAGSYFLDPATTAAFREIMGGTHGVDPGTVRTYLPGADPASELDALRHRILGTDRIVRDSSHRLALMLGRRAQEETLQAELPVRIRRVQRRVAEHVDRLLTEPVDVSSAGMHAPPAVDEAEAPSGIVELAPVQEQAVEAVTESAPRPGLERLAQRALAAVRRVLGVTDPSEGDWERLTDLALRGRGAGAAQDRATQQLSRLRDQLEQRELRERDLFDRLQDEQLEHAATVDELETTQRRNAYLEELLRRTELVGELYSEPTDGQEAGPEDFEELLTMIDQLEHVVFTGDADVTLALAQQDPLGTWARKTWTILGALEDYARVSAAQSFSGDVQTYLRNPPDGCRGYSVNKHATTESDDVQNNSRFREARVLPIPENVESSGCVEMLAHFKIAQSGLISPRLHYYDDTARSGKVYVGHIGPHLPTKRTN